VQILQLVQANQVIAEHLQHQYQVHHQALRYMQLLAKQLLVLVGLEQYLLPTTVF